MTEPATIKYTGGSSWIETGDGSNTKAHVLATYANAVQFFAYICKKYGFNPENSNVLMSHREGHAKESLRITAIQNISGTNTV